jgi:hypothetical protein
MATTDTETNRQYCNTYRSNPENREKFNKYQRDKQRGYRAARIAAKAVTEPAATGRGDRSHERAPTDGPKFYCRAFPAVCPQQRDGRYCAHGKRVCARQCLVYSRKEGTV